MQLPFTKTKPAPIQVPLEVTLAEVFNGAMKKVVYQRKKLGEDMVTYDEMVESHLYVKSGWEPGLVATLPGQGDEGAHLLPGDVEIRMVVAEDKSWAREGSTLIYTAEITLSEALVGTIVELPTLDGRVLSVPITQVIAPGDETVVPGEGMPTEAGGKGDLVLQFDIRFPTTLSIAQKAALKKAFAG